MDVLAYSAFNQQVSLNQQIVAKTSCLSTKCSETAAQQAAAASFSSAAVCWVQCIEPCLLRNPSATSFWSCIPDLIGATGGFKVCRCANNTFFNYGACCLWTVPSGVTRVRFQLWGAGGASGHGCCCGGSPFGSTGAYASVIIPVTSGCQYTICAGCAIRNFGCGGSVVCRFPGCPSWVQGPGLCNFCASGGQGSLGNWMAALGRRDACKITLVGYNYCGSRICNGGGDFCSAGSCSCTGGIIPHIPGAAYFGTTTSTTNPSIVYGIRGMWPCHNASNYQFTTTHPPIYGFTSCSTCQEYRSTSCAGCFGRACCGFLQIPGAGGWPTSVFAGCTTAVSDYGRSGMVCVSFC